MPANGPASVMALVPGDEGDQSLVRPSLLPCAYWGHAQNALWLLLVAIQRNVTLLVCVNITHFNFPPPHLPRVTGKIHNRIAMKI